MTRTMAIALALAAAPLAATQATARQDAALKDLMPKGLVIGVAINQRQSDLVDTQAACPTRNTSSSRSATRTSSASSCGTATWSRA